MFLILNIVVLILSFFILCSFIKNKIVRVLVALLFSLFTTLQISSLYLVKTFINYSFIIHLNIRDILGMLDLYISNLLVFIFAVIILTLLFSYSNFFVKKMSILNRFKKSKVLFFKLFIIVYSTSVMTSEGGLINVSSKLASILNTNKDNSLKKNLEELGISNYVFPNDLISIGNKKNIIILSLESFERGYLSDKFSHLTPYLRSLKFNKEWNYYDMNENEGSRWTSGSLYTTLTGFPAFFGAEHNSIFQTTKSSNISSISHVLNNAGYDMTYFVSDAKFSGTRDMLNTFGINDIVDIKILQNSMHDKDLFENVKHKILEKKNSKNPFVFYISTLSTHNPNGIYDKRMKEFLPNQNSSIEFMASAVDYMIKDFMTYLKNLDMLDNTVVYILPDHLKHGSGKMFEGTGERGLFFLTNASDKKTKIKPKEIISQVDLSKIILNGAEIKHNAKFLSDYIEGDKNKFIEDNITKITQVNISGISRTKKPLTVVPKISKEYQTFSKDKSRFIAHAGGIINNKTYSNSLEALNLSYKRGFKMFNLGIIKTSDNKYVAADSWTWWKRITNNKSSSPVVSHKEFMKYKIYGKYTPLDMKRINEWFKNHPDAILVTSRIEEPKQFSKLFIDKQRLMMELNTLKGVEQGVKLNITVMPSTYMLNSISGNKVDFLKKNKIKYITFSRLSLSKNLDFLKLLKQNEIRAYAYHINKKIDKDEEYVVKYEMDYFYGIYADKWFFKNK